MLGVDDYSSLAIRRVSMADTRTARCFSCSASVCDPMWQDEEDVAGSSDFGTLPTALHEALALLGGAMSVRTLCQEEHGVGRGAQHVVGDVSVSPRDLLGELLRKRTELEGDSVGVELLMWERARGLVTVHRSLRSRFGVPTRLRASPLHG